MKKILKMACFTVVILIAATSIYAGWDGPRTVFIGEWGNGYGQFRNDNGDMTDNPLIEAVTRDGKIVISDIVSHKQVVIDANGKLVKEVKWQIIRQDGGKTFYDIPEYRFFGKIIVFGADGNIFVKGKKYYLVSPTGKVLHEYENPPKEMPERKHKDKISGSSIKRFNKCDELIADLNVQSDVADYGFPFVVPDGDVYVSKSTPNKYVILKWTWTEGRIEYCKSNLSLREGR